MPSIVDKSSIKKVCIDDFALKKRFSYGTVMVNIENHRIVDMIPSRDTATVSNWLASFSNLEIVSRDGSIMYASATQSSHSDAIQISDRFHLIKGLSEVINKYIIRKFPARIEIPLTSTVSEKRKLLYNRANRSLRIKFAHQKHKEGLSIPDIAFLLHSSITTIRKYLAIPEDEIPEDKMIAREKQHQLALQQKAKEIDEIKKMAQDGFPIEQIATKTHHTCKTIQNYLRPDYSIVNGHYHNRIPGKLAPYEKDVIELRSKGLTYVKIHELLCKKGYTGSVASLRMFMQKERTRTYNYDAIKQIDSEFIQRKSLCQLIYKKLENIISLNKDQYEEVIKKYPIIGNLYLITREFYNALFSKKPEKIDEWIKNAKKYDIPELQTFINGIEKDLTAVKNAIIYSYNNGLAEGSVNKIKVIKRIMYGRNSFELLKSKVLFHELLHSEFN